MQGGRGPSRAASASLTSIVHEVLDTSYLSSVFFLGLPNLRRSIDVLEFRAL
jgi:hypothetical protein